MTRYTYFKLVTFIVKTFPRRVVYLVTRVASFISYHLDRPKREAVTANLRVILGPEAPEKRLKSDAMMVNRNFSKYIAEFFGYGKYGGRFIDAHVEVVGGERIGEALREGKGVVLNTCHLSNWELGAALVARMGHRVMGVAQLQPDRKVNAMFAAQRRSRGYFTIPPEGAYRRCIEWLKKNRVLCFVGDRDIGEGSVDVDFFGRPTPFPQGPARIAIASGAPVLPCFVIRLPGDEFRAFAEPPIPVPERGSRREKAREMTQQYAGTVERHVREHYLQWGVFHDFWPERGRTT